MPWFRNYEEVILFRIFVGDRYRQIEGIFIRACSSGTVKSHSNTAIVAPKSGNAFVYCSNESPHNVFFDNIQVIHSRGPLLEETHYYPFGLTMAGISSKVASSLESKNKYNGIEVDNNFELYTYDAYYRELDP